MTATRCVVHSTTESHPTDLGLMISTWSDQGLYSLSWQDADPRSKTEENLPNETLPLSCGRWKESLSRGLVAYFDSNMAEAQSFFEQIQVDGSGWTPFQQTIYRQCRKISPGATVSYKKLAEASGRGGASRAVGAAMARNRVLIVVPCHRVIASNGKLTGYSGPGGLETKRRLLRLEKNASAQF